MHRAKGDRLVCASMLPVCDNGLSIDRTVVLTHAFLYTQLSGLSCMTTMCPEVELYIEDLT